MAEYISREEIAKFPIRTNHYDEEHGNAHFIYGIESVMEYIEEIPSADVEPVRHGRWVVENEYSIRCSECCFNRASIKMPMDYCPNCGAKMEKFGNPEQVKEFAKDINVLANSEQVEGEENAEVKPC